MGSYLPPQNKNTHTQQQHDTSSELKLHMTGTGLFIHKLELILPASTCSACFNHLVKQSPGLPVKIQRDDQSTMTIRRFQAEYPGRGAPSWSTILRIVEKYFAHGTSANRNQGHSGCPRNTRKPANIGAVRQSLISNAEVSSKRNNIQNLS